MFYINSYLQSYIEPIQSDILDYLERGEIKSKKSHIDNDDIKSVLSTVFSSLMNLSYYDLYESKDAMNIVNKIKSYSKVGHKISEMIKYYTNMIKDRFFMEDKISELHKDIDKNGVNCKNKLNNDYYRKSDAKIIGYIKSKIEFCNSDGKKAILRIYHPRYYVRE